MDLMLCGWQQKKRRWQQKQQQQYEGQYQLAGSLVP
jgi:hypothetical protein